MAKSINKYNVAVQQQSGKVGTVRYYQKGGNTYVRSASNSVTSNPRTDLQMYRRLRWASRSVLWSVMKGNLLNAFTTKSGAQSDYNMFMKLNDTRGVYFTKDQLAGGYQVIFPLQITEGKLDSIICTLSGTRLLTNIGLGSLTLGTDTTISDFAAAVVANNADFEYGDEIAFASIQQSTNGASVPKVTANFYRVVLVKGDTRKVHSVATADAFQTVNGMLGTNESLPTGCFTYIHSRRDDGLKVSSQTLISNNSAMIAVYRSTDQYELAVASYGDQESSFLDPGTSIIESSEEGTYYTISVGYASGSTSSMGTVSGGGSYAEGASAVISASPLAGYKFVSWDDGDTSATRTVTVSANHEYLALFAESSTTQVTLTVNVADDQSSRGAIRIGTNSASQSQTKTVSSGTSVSISAVANSGWQFQKWSDNNTSSARSIVVSEATTLTAYFEEEEEDEGGDY